MNLARIKFFTLYILFIQAIPTGAFNQLERDYLKFEQLLLTNNNIIEFSAPYSQIEATCLTSSRSTPALKPWTFMVYIAADNDLRAFAVNNIKQMAAIGSNENINIVVHLDIRLNENQKVTRWYYIDQNKITQLNHDPATQRMDSGDPQTLITFCGWAIKAFPARNYALILWNHGTGVLDPKYYKIVNPSELFSFNPATHKFELDRSVEYLDLFDYPDLDQRGICFDNSTGNYISNQKLEYALNEICMNHLQTKFKLIGFDACLMSMLEIANFIKYYADSMVSSQEAELGAGWNYTHVLQPFTTASIDYLTFAAHIVKAYHLAYQHITNDYTQSAIDLRKLSLLEQNTDLVARLLIECLQKQQNNSVRDAIHASRHRKACTHFDVSSYIDLHHFYLNLQNQLRQFRLNNRSNLIKQLNNALADGRRIIEEIVIANACGKNLKNAKGISIYFPDYIQSSYHSSRFAKENGWAAFLQHYRSTGV